MEKEGKNENKHLDLHATHKVQIQFEDADSSRSCDVLC